MQFASDNSVMMSSFYTCRTTEMMKTRHLCSRRPSWGKEEKKVDKMRQVSRDQRFRVMWVLQDFSIMLTKVFSFSFLFLLSFPATVMFNSFREKVRQHLLKVNDSAAAHNTSFLELHNYNIYEDFMRLSPLLFLGRLGSAPISSSFVLLVLFSWLIMRSLVVILEGFGGACNFHNAMP